MSLKRISLLILTILSLAAAVALIRGSFSPPPRETPADADQDSARNKQPPTPPVNLPALAQTAQNPPPLTPEQIEDDEQTEKEQADAALAQLNSADTEQRIEGAEQLGAFPTKEAELALAQTLIGDSEADVRNAAAQSLGYVEKPTDDTIATLLAALEDPNEDVRASALSTLEDFLAGTDEGTKRYKKVLAGLQAKAAARSTPQDIRDAIGDIMADLEGSTP